MSYLPALPTELLLQIISQALEDRKTVRALSQTCRLLQTLCTPIIFEKLVIKFQHPIRVCKMLSSFSTEDGLARRAASRHTKRVKLQLANLNESILGEVQEHERSSGVADATDYARRLSEIETYRSCLGPVLRSLHNCTYFKIEIVHGKFREAAPPVWMVDIISGALSSFSDLTVLAIDLTYNMIPPKPFIKEGTCSKLKEFTIRTPDKDLLTDNDVEVILETIDIAISDKPNLDRLELRGSKISFIDSRSDFLGPIFGGPRLKKSPPLRIKKLALHTMFSRKETISHAMIHLQKLEHLCLDYSNHCDSAFWEILAASGIRLRSLDLSSDINANAKALLPLEEYLISYTGLEYLTIDKCPVRRLYAPYRLQPMREVLRAHSSTLRELKIYCSLPEDHCFLLEARRLEVLSIAVRKEAELQRILKTLRSMSAMRILAVDLNPDGILWATSRVISINRGT